MAEIFKPDSVGCWVDGSQPERHYLQKIAGILQSLPHPHPRDVGEALSEVLAGADSRYPSDHIVVDAEQAADALQEYCAPGLRFEVRGPDGDFCLTETPLGAMRRVFGGATWYWQDAPESRSGDIAVASLDLSSGWTLRDLVYGWDAPPDVFEILDATTVLVEAPEGMTPATWTAKVLLGEDETDLPFTVDALYCPYGIPVSFLQRP